MKEIKVKFADSKKHIRVQAADDIDEVLSNLEFDAYEDSRLNEIESLDELVNEINEDGHSDIITGMHAIDFNNLEDNKSYVFSIGKTQEVEQLELDENEYEYKYFITSNNEIYVYYSLCE